MTINLQSVMVTIRHTTFFVDPDGKVFRQVGGKLKPIASGKLVAQAQRLASNLRAIRESAAKREKKASG